MTIEDLKTRPEFVGGLTDQQKSWVVEYCTNGADKIEATKAAYPKCTTPPSIIGTADRNLRHTTISRLVNEFYGRAEELPTKEQVQSVLWKKIQSNPSDKFMISYLELYGRWSGFDIKPASPETGRPVGEPTVDELLTQLSTEAPNVT